MKIFLIADIHHGENTNYKTPKYKGEDYINSFGEEFEKYLPEIHGAIKEHDLVVNLGDLIREESEQRDPEKFKTGMKLLDVGVPVYHVIGNHDLRFMTREVVADLIGKEKVYYSFDQAGCHHIILDSNKADPRISNPNLKADLPLIDETQIEWLKSDLAKTELPTLVYTHFPIDSQSMTDNYYFQANPAHAFPYNQDVVRDILEKSGKVLAVFSGHVHFHSDLTINGIRHVTVPAFTENDGYHKPQASYASVEVKGKELSVEVIKI